MEVLRNIPSSSNDGWPRGVENMTETVRMTVVLPRFIVEALKVGAMKEKRELNEHIQRLLADLLKKETPQEYQGEAGEFQLMWTLVDRAAEEAKKIAAEHGVTRSITLDAIRACKADPKWLAGYAEFVQDDIYKSGIPRKGTINREIGFRIRAAVNGTVELNANGKPVNVRVPGEIIQTYTAMIPRPR
jgi:hypothetical protein